MSHEGACKEANVLESFGRCESLAIEAGDRLRTLQSSVCGCGSIPLSENDDCAKAAGPTSFLARVLRLEGNLNELRAVFSELEGHLIP